MAIDLIYVAARLNAALTAVFLAAILFVTGGWQAAFAALAMFAGIGFALSAIALLVLGEGTSGGRA
jgi:hypothetical protein